MKIFLAGVENTPSLKVAAASGLSTALFSYYHLSKMGTAGLTKWLDEVHSRDLELICDSGLFTLMFGAGKGGNYDFKFMQDYTTKYIQTAKSWGIKNLTIVECDVHKILGMPAVFELRKQFEDSGMNVLYVWHKEEEISGLINMSQKYPYIALSVPELRLLFSGQSERYQNAVFDLLRIIRQNNETMPKIHLLGNTVQETMETRLAYSCDSTSWIAGGKFGRGTILRNGRLKSLHTSDPLYLEYKKRVFELFTEHQKKIYESFEKETTRSYYSINLLSAIAYRLYQDNLNRSHPWVGLTERITHVNQRQFADITYRDC